jgi:hypothetical protein
MIYSFVIATRSLTLSMHLFVTRPKAPGGQFEFEVPLPAPRGTFYLIGVFARRRVCGSVLVGHVPWGHHGARVMWCDFVEPSAAVSHLHLPPLLQRSPGAILVAILAYKRCPVVHIDFDVAFGIAEAHRLE